MLRRLLYKSCSWDTFHAGAKRILATAGMPDVQTQFHIHRLRYLASFVQVGVTESWALAHRQGGWLALVRSSLQWLWCRVAKTGNPSGWNSAIAGWLDMIRSSPGKWKALIRKARNIAIWEDRVADLHQQFLGLAAKQLAYKGAQVPPRDAEQLDSTEASVEVCGPCGRTFKDKRAWAVHAFKCHGRVREARKLVSGFSCPSCLKLYASHIRLCNHLHHSTRCFQQLRLAGFQVQTQPGQNSRKANRLAPPFGPVLDLQGPLPQMLDAEEDIETPIVGQLVAAFRELWSHLDIVLWDQVLGFYRQALLSHCASLSDLSSAFARAQHHLCGQSGEELPLHQLVLHRRALDWLQRNFTASWLLEGEASPLARGLCTFRDAAAIWDALDFQNFPEVQFAACDGAVTFGIVLVEILQWASDLLPGARLLGAVACDDTGLSGFWNAYKESVAFASNNVLYLNLSTEAFSSMLCMVPQSLSQWEMNWKSRQLLYDVALIFVTARSLGQPALFLLPEGALPLIQRVLQIPGVHFALAGPALLYCGIEPSGYSHLCFTV